MNLPTTGTWTAQWTPTAAKQLRQIQKKNRKTAELLRNAMQQAALSGEPRSRGRGLTGNRAGQWRYRIGDYRLIVDIRDHELVVLALEVGHRSDIY